MARPPMPRAVTMSPAILASRCSIRQAAWAASSPNRRTKVASALPLGDQGMNTFTPALRIKSFAGRPGRRARCPFCRRPASRTQPAPLSQQAVAEDPQYFSDVAGPEDRGDPEIDQRSGGHGHKHFSELKCQMVVAESFTPQPGQSPGGAACQHRRAEQHAKLLAKRG